MVTWCLENKTRLRYLKKVTSSTIQCELLVSENKARCAARKHTCDDQADCDSINHVTSQIFSNSSFQKCTQWQKKNEERRGEGAFLKEKDFNVFNTH